MMVKKIRLKSNRTISLVHLAILVAHKNGSKEDEWPNFEFYPTKEYYATDNSGVMYEDQYGAAKSYIRPFRFKSTIFEILK